MSNGIGLADVLDIDEAIEELDWLIKTVRDYDELGGYEQHLRWSEHVLSRLLIVHKKMVKEIENDRDSRRSKT